MLTGLKDTDREILKHVTDAELPKFFCLNKTFYFKICDDNFLRRRLDKYPTIFKYRDKRESIKLFYSRAVCRIFKMRRDYDFSYYEGDFYKQFTLFHNFNGNILFYNSCEDGEFPLVKYCVEKGCDVNISNDYCLRLAAVSGRLDIVKYLIEKGANPAANDCEILRASCGKGHLEIVKYAVEILKFNIHMFNEICLRRASAEGHLQVVQYLVDRGALIHLNNYESIRLAKENKHFTVVDYLEFVRRKNLKIL